MRAATKDLLLEVTVAIAFLGSLLGAPDASAQSADLEGRWGGRAGLIHFDSSEVGSDGGTSADIDSDVAVKLGIGYHLSDHIELGGTISFSTVDYDAQIAGDEPREFFGMRGELESATFMADATCNLPDGPSRRS